MSNLLLFNQSVHDEESFAANFGSEIVGVPHEEGFTSLHTEPISGGLALALNGKIINETMINKGIPVPRISKEEIKDTLSIVEKLVNDGFDKTRVFFLVSNSSSCFLANKDKIKVLGYFRDDIFYFAAQDEKLRHYKDVSPLGNGLEIFKKEGRVVIYDQHSQKPVTIINPNSNYMKVTEPLLQARNQVLNFMKEGTKVTEYQAFVWLVANDTAATEEFISHLTNKEKRSIYQKIKVNFYYFYTLIDQSVLEKQRKMFINYRKDLPEEELSRLEKFENIPKVWKQLYCALTDEFEKKGSLDVLKHLTNTGTIIIISRLCVKFDGRRHVIS